MKALKIIQIIFSLTLGGMMLYGGIRKFEKPTPSPTEIIEKVKSNQEVAPSVEILKIKNYIFGMKQTDFFWQFLGFTEILAGVLLLSIVFWRIGAIVALPLTINIFLFHLFVGLLLWLMFSGITRYSLTQWIGRLRRSLHAL